MTMPKLKIKKGDEVIILAGKDKGKRGKVLRAMPREERVVVQGVNMVTRHVKPSRTGAGGIEKNEGSIHVSNVSLVDATSGKPTRVGYKMQDGKKQRVSRRSGEVI